MINEVINLKDVSKVYRTGEVEFTALKNVNLSIPVGSYTSIMGPSGSGKSTLMNIIGCLDRPTKGNYFLEGIDIKEKSEDELSFIRNQKIGFVFQSFNLIARTSAVKNVELPMIYAKMHANDRHERAKQLLEKVGLGDRIHHMPNELSGGQRQRVALARLMAYEPDVLLLDEPFSALDEDLKEDLLRELKSELQISKPVIFVSHDKEEVNYLCDLKYKIKQGEII